MEPGATLRERRERRMPLRKAGARLAMRGEAGEVRG